MRPKVPSRIAVPRIPVHARTYPLSLDVPWLGRSCQAAIDAVWSECNGSVTLQRYEERVEVMADISYRVECACEVCGSPVEYQHRSNQPLIYLPSNFENDRNRQSRLPKTARDLDKISHQIALDDEDLDVGWYDNGEIDLSIVITELIVLDRPSLIACNNDNVVRIVDGECVTFPTESGKNTHKPFANLPDFD